jgi:AcrR family transcriptional regulator
MNVPGDPASAPSYDSRSRDSQTDRPARAGTSVRRARVHDVRQVALSLFAERGYHGTSMSDIAAVLGVRVPTLYSHIRSKQELLAEIAVTTTEAVLADFERATHGIADVSERLRRAIEAYALRHATHPREALVVNRDIFSLEEPTRSAVLASRHRHERSVRQLIIAGVEDGIFRVRSPAIASFAMLEMSVSVARWFRPDGQLSPEQVARLHSEFALSIAKSDG